MDSLSYVREWLYVRIVKFPTSLLYAVSFFTCMILHELVLEAASHEFQYFDDFASGVTLFQFGFCFLLPLILSGGEAVNSFPRTFNEAHPYMKLSVVVAGATALATRALVYVSYPTKVIFKSAKLIPCMVIGSYYDRGSIGSKYSAIDYLAAFLLCAGATGYTFSENSDKLLTDSKDVEQEALSKEEEPLFTPRNFGICLLFISVCCDAFLPNLQLQFMKDKSHSKEDVVRVKGGERNADTAASLMVNTNGIGVMVLVVYMTLSGSLFNIAREAFKTPILLGYLSAVGLGLSSGVLAYTSLVKSSGPVVAVGVAMMRKIVTVLLSFFFFPKPFTFMHMLSAFLVLCGVLISSRPRNKSKLEQEVEKEEAGGGGGGLSLSSPSMKGMNHKSVSWKQYDSNYHHEKSSQSFNLNDEEHGGKYEKREQSFDDTKEEDDSTASSSMLIARLPSEQLFMADRVVSDQVILSSRILSV